MADDSELFVSWAYTKLTGGSSYAIATSGVHRAGQVPQTGSRPGKMVVLSKITGSPFYAQGPTRSGTNALLQVEAVGAVGDSYEDLSALIDAIDADLDTKHEYPVSGKKVVCYKQQDLPDRVDSAYPEIPVRGAVYRGHIQPNIG